MKLDIVEHRVKNWRETLKWWEKLGLNVVVKEEDDKFALVDAGGIMIGVWGTKNKSEQNFVPYFRTDNLEATIAKLKKKEINIGQVETQHWGKQAKIVDPEGNELYIFEEKRSF